MRNKDEIEKNIKQIEAIEGNEGLLGRYCQVRYLIWQAQRAADKETREAIQLKAHRCSRRSECRDAATGLSFL